MASQRVWPVSGCGLRRCLECHNTAGSKVDRVQLETLTTSHTSYMYNHVCTCTHTQCIILCTLYMLPCTKPVHNVWQSIVGHTMTCVHDRPCTQVHFMHMYMYMYINIIHIVHVYMYKD